MKKSTLLFIVFLLLLKTSFSQETVTSLSIIKGTYKLTNNDVVNFSFDKIVINKNSFSLFLNDELKENFKQISTGNDFIEFEKVYESNINSPEIKRVKIKIFKISETELKVIYTIRENTVELNLTKTNKL